MVVGGTPFAHATTEGSTRLANAVGVEGTIEALHALIVACQLPSLPEVLSAKKSGPEVSSKLRSSTRYLVAADFLNLRGPSFGAQPLLLVVIVGLFGHESTHALLPGLLRSSGSGDEVPSLPSPREPEPRIGFGLLARDRRRTDGRTRGPAGEKFHIYF